MEKGYTIPILDKGFVRYIDHLGSDTRIVESARISYKSPSKGEEQDKKLLRYLYRNRHTSPFEQCNITFNIKMPIFIMRQFVRHRTFRLNEWSARYSELMDEFYVPTEWRSPDEKNKQGSTTAGLDHDKLTNQVETFNKQAYETYRSLLEQGVARELARTVLPVSIFTEIYVNCDLHNLLHFLHLREDHHAQWEVREVARGMREIAEALYPWTFEAYQEFKVKTVKVETV
ncbi:MAG: FAD-dependent thymidylate synthase [Verrucomicrobiota bacterium]